MSTRRMRPDHRVVHVGDRTRSNPLRRTVLGAEGVPSTGVGAADRSPVGGWCGVRGPGTVAPPPARSPVPPGGEPCLEWPGPIAGAAAHPRYRGGAVEPGPVRHMAGREGGEGVSVRDPDGSSPGFISRVAP